MLSLPATHVALAAHYFFPRATWWWFLIVTNSLVGFVYMVRERRALATKGSRVAGVSVKLGAVHNLIVNALFHIALPVALATRLKHPIKTSPRALLVEGLGLALIDRHALYPVGEGRSIDDYAIAHACLLTSLVVAFEWTSRR